MRQVRIVAAVPHNDSQELEVILEITLGAETFNSTTELKSIWIDSDRLSEMADG